MSERTIQFYYKFPTYQETLTSQKKLAISSRNGEFLSKKKNLDFCAVIYNFELKNHYFWFKMYGSMLQNEKI